MRMSSPDPLHSSSAGGTSSKTWETRLLSSKPLRQISPWRALRGPNLASRRINSRAAAALRGTNVAGSSPSRHGSPASARMSSATARIDASPPCAARKSPTRSRAKVNRTSYTKAIEEVVPSTSRRMPRPSNRITSRPFRFRKPTPARGRAARRPRGRPLRRSVASSRPCPERGGSRGCGGRRRDRTSAGCQSAR